MTSSNLTIFLSLLLLALVAAHSEEERAAPVAYCDLLLEPRSGRVLAVTVDFSLLLVDPADFAVRHEEDSVRRREEGWVW